MRSGKAIPVWFSDLDRLRVEEAAAAAGYRHLSKFIRDRCLSRGGGEADVGAWADHQELSARLADLERQQRLSQALSAMVLFLVRRWVNLGDFNAMRAALENAGVGEDVLASIAPDVAELIKRFEQRRGADAAP